MITLVKNYPKTTFTLIFIVGFGLGQLNPIDWIYWKIAEIELPKIKARALTEKSPFYSIPKEQWLLETEKAFVIECDEKKSPLHFLVVSKEPIVNVHEADAETLNAMFQLVNMTVEKYGFKDQGFRIVINTNPLGAQTVYHLHIHILSGRQLRWPPG